MEHQGMSFQLREFFLMTPARQTDRQICSKIGEKGEGSRSVGHTSPYHGKCMTMPIGSSGICDLLCAKDDANDDAPMEHVCVHRESPAHCNCAIICPAGRAAAARIRSKGAALSHADRVAMSSSSTTTHMYGV